MKPARLHRERPGDLHVVHILTARPARASRLFRALVAHGFEPAILSPFRACYWQDDGSGDRIALVIYPDALAALREWTDGAPDEHLSDCPLVVLMSNLHLDYEALPKVWRPLWMWTSRDADMPAFLCGYGTAVFHGQKPWSTAKEAGANAEAALDQARDEVPGG